MNGQSSALRTKDNIMIYIPFNEELCSYTDNWLGELYENKYPLVSKGMWSAMIDLKAHKLLTWKQEYRGFNVIII